MMTNLAKMKGKMKDRRKEPVNMAIYNASEGLSDARPIVFNPLST